MGKICWVRIKIDGIYTWGKGYESKELHDAWKGFFNDNEGNHFKGFVFGIADKGSSTETPFISNLWGSFFCHPMEITGATITTSASDDFKYELGRLDEFVESLCHCIQNRTGIKPTYKVLYKIQDETMNNYSHYGMTA